MIDGSLIVLIILGLIVLLLLSAFVTRNWGVDVAANDCTRAAESSTSFDGGGDCGGGD